MKGHHNNSLVRSQHGGGVVPGGPLQGGQGPGGLGSLDLQSIGSIILRGKWTILATVVVVVGAVAAYTYNLAPTYRASSIVAVNGGHSLSGSSLMPAMVSRMNEQSIYAELGFLENSNELRMRVAQRLRDTASALGTTANYPILSDATDSSVAEPGQVAGQLASRVNFNPDHMAGMITIAASSSSPEEASRIANIFAEEYQKYARENSRANLVAAREFLEGQVQEREAELRQLESRWKNYAEDRHLITQGQGGERVVSEYADLSSRLEENEFQIESEQTAIRLLERELERVQPDLAENVGSGTQSQIGALQEKIAELTMEAERYYNVNPDLRGNEQQEPELQRLQTSIDRYEQRKDELVNEWIEESMGSGVAGAEEQLGYAAQVKRQILDKQLAVRRLEADQTVLESRLSSYEGRLDEIPQQRVELEQLDRRRSIVEQWYNSFVGELQRIQVAEQSNLGYVDIVREAGIPGVPIAPDPVRNLMIAVLAGLVLGCGLVFIRSAIRSRIDDPDDVAHLGYDVVGVIPPMTGEIKRLYGGEEQVEVSGRRRSTRLMTLLNPWSPVSENFRLVRTNLRNGSFDSVPKTLLVSSPDPSDGKTVTAVNLAIAMSQSGRRTLLIDADMRKPSCHAMLGMDNKIGLVELLMSGRTTLPEEHYLETEIEGFHFLSAGSLSSPPPELLEGSTMKQLLKFATERYDIVIVDSPPVLAATDSVLLSKLTEATLLVASSEKTRPRSLTTARNLLDSAGATVRGIVLNRFESRGQDYSYYGYGYGYGHGYDTEP